MERIQDSLHLSDAQDFMGKEGFVWWYGVVEDRKDPLYLGRVKVRCIGFHTDDKSEIPTDDLPWAQVILPITSAAMSGIGQSPTGIVEGSHVFGFFRDSHEAQEPVVLGTCIGIPSTIANRRRGFFDPRKYKERKKYPYPPLFTDRRNDGTGATIVDFDEEGPDGEEYAFTGKNNFAERNAILSYVRRNDKVMANVTADDGTLLYSQQAYSAFPNENYMRFDQDAGLVFSLPSTNVNAGTRINFTKQKENSANPVASVHSQIGRINREINEAAQTIHKEIPATFSLGNETRKNFQMPRSYVYPEYPFNHVQYTESGHLFELDDTPGFERIRLLHRSLTFYEIDNQGNKIENVVGDSFLFNDGDAFSHIIGNEVKTVGGALSLILNNRRATTNNTIKVGEKGSLFIETESGDITIKARGTLNLEAANFNTAKIPLDSASSSDYSIGDRNIKFTKVPNFTVESDNTEYQTKGEYTIGASSLTTSVEGDIILGSTLGSVNLSAQRSVRESITGLPFAVGKSVSLLLGKMEHSVLDPTGGIDLFVGSAASNGFAPPLKLTSFSMSKTGIEIKSNVPGPLGSIALDSKGDVKSTAAINTQISTLGGSLKLIKGTPGAGTEISINEAGLVAIKNPGVSLFTLLNELLTALSSLSVGTGTGPSTPPLNAAQFAKLQTQLSTLFTA